MGLLEEYLDDMFETKTKGDSCGVVLLKLLGIGVLFLKAFVLTQLIALFITTVYPTFVVSFVVSFGILLITQFLLFCTGGNNFPNPIRMKLHVHYGPLVGILMYHFLIIFACLMAWFSAWVYSIILF